MAGTRKRTPTKKPGKVNAIRASVTPTTTTAKAIKSAGTLAATRRTPTTGQVSAASTTAMSNDLAATHLPLVAQPPVFATIDPVRNLFEASRPGGRWCAPTTCLRCGCSSSACRSWPAACRA